MNTAPVEAAPVQAPTSLTALVSNSGGPWGAGGIWGPNVAKKPTPTVGMFLKQPF